MEKLKKQLDIMIERLSNADEFRSKLELAIIQAFKKEQKLRKRM